MVVSTVGQRATDYYKRRRTLVRSWRTGASADYALAAEVAKHLSDRYEAGEIDGVEVVFNEFVSALTQRPQRVRLLPFVPEFSRLRSYEPQEERQPYEFEPRAEAVLNVLIPLALEYTVLRGLLENQAGEHAARMTAMESATRNTEKLIHALTMQMNRARQAAITRELVEIVSGAEALSG